MQKRVFIVHMWDGSPKDGWYGWLKKELEARGFSVHVPTMPNTSAPKIKSWVAHLSKIVGAPDENTFFVGHSIGCQAILRYLETLPPDKKVGGAVFVAGWFTLKNLETKAEQRIAKPWLETPIDFKKVTRHTKKFVAILSDNDPVVPLENKKLFETKLGARTIVQHNKGHFTADDGALKLPILLQSLLKIAA